MIPRALSYEISLLEADLCAALAEPTRILILDALNIRSRSVTEISIELGIPQSGASRHLKVLRDRGLVHTTRQGTSVIYRLANHEVIQALDLLQSVLRTSIQHQGSLMRDVSTSR